MQRVVGTKYSLPEVGLGEPGTNTHDSPGSPSIEWPLVKPRTQPRPASSGTSTTCAKIPTCVSASATCFHDR